MTAPAAPDHAAVAAYWKAAKAANPAVRGDTYRTRAFGNTSEVMRAMIDFVLKGEKRGTFVVPDMAGADPLPRVGDYTILLDFDGKPGALFATTAVDDVPFDQITDAHTAVEGPGLREVERWKAAHKGYFAKAVEAAGKTFSGETRVLVEHFKLVYPDGGARA